MAGKPGPPMIERLMAKVEKTPDGCWLWRGALMDTGYGRIGLGHKAHYTHRVTYETFVGPIPDGYQLDHLCRVRSCCNPKHLEAVTQRINCVRGDGFAGLNARKTHCPQGHEYVGHNVMWSSRDGHGMSRRCRACNDQRNAQRKGKSRVVSS